MSESACIFCRGREGDSLNHHLIATRYDLERAIAERDEARAERDALIGAGCSPEQNALALLDLYAERVISAERERDEARAEIERTTRERDEARVIASNIGHATTGAVEAQERAEAQRDKAERERDVAQSLASRAESDAEISRAIVWAREKEVISLRAQLALAEKHSADAIAARDAMRAKRDEARESLATAMRELAEANAARDRLHALLHGKASGALP